MRSALDTAKVPKRRGKRGIPASSSDIPNVKRLKEVVISVPAVDTKRPKKAEIKPLTVEPVTRIATVDSPMMHKTVYSGGPKRRATLARRGEKIIRIKALIRPPQTEAVVMSPIALPASPLSAMG